MFFVRELRGWCMLCGFWGGVNMGNRAKYARCGGNRRLNLAWICMWVVCGFWGFGRERIKYVDGLWFCWYG